MLLHNPTTVQVGKAQFYMTVSDTSSPDLMYIIAFNSESEDCSAAGGWLSGWIQSAKEKVIESHQFVLS
jgi:hypothetical protein